jgi:diadenosine tetraphosphate (Ap4A) HIT family hydrolase
MIMKFESSMTSPFLDDRKHLLENDIGFVIFDGFPVNEGHCLIIPHRVYADYFDSSVDEREGLNKLLFEARKYLTDRFNPTGFNVGINCGKDGGQTVPHMHIHLIPRYKNDVEDPRGGVRGVIPTKQKY